MDTLLKVKSSAESMRCVHCERSFRVDEMRKIANKPPYTYECWISTFTASGVRIPSCIELLHEWKIDIDDIQIILRALGGEIDG